MATYRDPFRWRFHKSGEDYGIGDAPRVDQVENDMCSLKIIMMHRPTHDPQRDKAGDYVFSHHLAGRRRLWEIRLQLRFKRLPEQQVFFGIELQRFVPVSGMTRQAQKVLLSACRSIVGDCYHSPGDDPRTTAGEAELPQFVMPLWAFDQFVVSEAGEEPALDGDMEGKGMRRTEGVSAYISAMKAAINGFSLDKVYTFSFWGISQFLDIMQWEVTGGVLPGVRLDFNKLCGQPPVTVTMYELTGSKQDTERRHLTSRKRYYMQVAFWSTLKPPKEGDLPEIAIAEEEAADNPAGQAQAQAPAPATPEFEDLLGLCSEEPPLKEAAVKQPQQKVESVDLLGLDF